MAARKATVPRTARTSPIAQARSRRRQANVDDIFSCVNGSSTTLRTWAAMVAIATLALPVIAATAGTAAAAGSAGSAGWGPPTATSRRNDHACVASPGTPRVAWRSLANPILSEPTAGIKDEAIVWYRGLWHMLFSEVTDDPALPGGVRWNIGSATSPNLRHWSTVTSWPPQRGVLGVASPDVVRAPGGDFVVTYQSDPGQRGGGQDKLYYRTSRDLRAWSAPHPLARGLAPSAADRMIDPALAWTPHGLVLAYKAGTVGASQHMVIGWSRSGSLRGPWRRLGRPDIVVNGGTVENYELLIVNGTWRLVATSNILDQPWIFSMAGNPSRLSSWLHWVRGRELQVPSQAWNSGPGISSIDYEHANSAFLCVVGATDYLWYAGSRELTQFGGWGHAKIGVARSPNLRHWEVPPG